MIKFSLWLSYIEILIINITKQLLKHAVIRVMPMFFFIFQWGAHPCGVVLMRQTLQRLDGEIRQVHKQTFQYSHDYYVQILQNKIYDMIKK